MFSRRSLECFSFRKSVLITDALDVAILVYSRLHVSSADLGQVDGILLNRSLLEYVRIFKNLTIILIAYGEVFMFNGVVTGLTLCAFALMVRPCSSFDSSLLLIKTKL